MKFNASYVFESLFFLFLISTKEYLIMLTTVYTIFSIDYKFLFLYLNFRFSKRPFLTAKFNAEKFSCWDMVRAHVVVYETLMEDPVDQVQGFVHVGDGSGSSKTHVTIWNPVDFARLMKWGEVGFSPIIYIY